MERELKYLLGMMSPEVFYEWSELAREQVRDPFPRFRELNPDFPTKVQAQFAALLTSRSMTTSDYATLTDVEFDDNDRLYEFLDRTYHYIFDDHGLDDPPYPIIDE
ncbi:hypothetical protein ACWIGI_26895 [Nocardia sp. NPDC055321]